MNSPLSMNDSKAYLAAVSDILASGLPNYCGKHIHLPSVFNWKYIDKHIGSCHDGHLINYLKFRFPFSLKDRDSIHSKAIRNNYSATSYSRETDIFIEKELEEGVIFGPFNEEPHPQLTWSPVMTRPKGSGRRVVLDLSYGKNSVNSAMDKN